MSLSDLIRSGYALAKSITESLQVEITLEQYDKDDSYGNRTYKTGVAYQVVWDQRTRYLSGQDRSQQTSSSSVQFMEPVAITQRDRITLPDGTKPQILSIEGPTDSNGAYFAPKVFF